MSGKLILAAAGTILAALTFSSPASALTMKECSTKYQAAKADGSAATMKWNDYRAKFCGAEAAVADKADEDEVAKTAEKEPEKPTMVAPKGTKFPKAVDKKYATETPAKGRLHTCVDAYHANKDAGTLNDLKWIQKGGGYWSLCNTALKAAG
ncbi:RTX toxin hemolysin-type calcium-binding protein [Neorhizobium galegae bv. officinalis bv. officinalis str. HAMBI 1141]|jgi:hypothetical protein|uniref:RTX toxin hemolysin-type calcium-binding protein n=1 Tax=Neorhizobium galegae bv. officinalis bv. officinalis str. HAMBI 1141 TaxID=1028801 RepID=A0A068TCA7_NEOGA|nr:MULTISPECIES: hypothetical protein [Neorhizobium]MCJ9671610.1 hypothetical protein [Neorhizobium sp. SHOUNA12B]MCJ9747304.1 hypothetical protein [Neorhizobium sp. SHOUNA12A]CDN54975.1 RTX toxin hemolysin-type calcium-binding protein [Neorhizobium galegae bv. officinalis bv. officinalis str. HAMBI 1141]